MKIIDAHMHLPVDCPDFPSKRAALLWELEKNEVCGAVVISDSELESGIGSMRCCRKLFSDVSNVWTVGGISPFIAFDEQLAELESGLIAGDIVGIKLYCGHEHFFLDSAELDPVFALAEQYGVPVLFHSGWDSPQYSAPSVIERAAKARRNVTMICCHCCFPDTEKCFETLVGYDNLLFDISSLADSPQHIGSVKASLEKYIPEMPERFIFGSDSFCCDQAEHIRFAERLNISLGDKELLFSGNAERTYKIPPKQGGYMSDHRSIKPRSRRFQ